MGRDYQGLVILWLGREYLSDVAVLVYFNDKAERIDASGSQPFLSPLWKISTASLND